MGMAMRGLTHCEKCGKALNYDEYVLCKYCEKEENKKSNIELKKCKYCEEREDKTIRGEKFELLSTAGFKYDRIYESWIMKKYNLSFKHTKSLKIDFKQKINILKSQR